MKPALPAVLVASMAFAIAAVACAQISSANPAAQRQAADPLRLAIYESQLQKWKRQCRRGGGTYERYCAGGVKHCCCYSAGYCEGIPEPVDALRQPAVPNPGSGGATGPPAGQPAPRLR